VNDLSGTIDLESTLIRAESLFRRFQRTLEAVDKKNNFPVPSVRQRKPAEDLKSPVARSSATESMPSASIAKGIGAEKERTISPELRSLLNRKIQTLDKRAVQQHGGGV
jgi:TBC1 domain family member 15